MHFLIHNLNKKPSQVPAVQAHNISILLAKLFESAGNNGTEVFL